MIPALSLTFSLVEMNLSRLTTPYLSSAPWSPIRGGGS